MQYPMTEEHIRSLVSLAFPKEPTTMLSGYHHLLAMDVAVADQQMHTIQEIFPELIKFSRQFCQATATHLPLFLDQ